MKPKNVSAQVRRERANPTVPIRIGPYALDGMLFDVELQPGNGGGEFWWPTSPRSKLSRPMMTVGIDCEWHEVVKSTLHELFEAATMHRRCLLQRTTWLTDDSSGRHILHLDHAQFTEVCVAVGDVLTYLLPDLSEAVRKAHRDR